MLNNLIHQYNDMTYSLIYRYSLYVKNSSFYFHKGNLDDASFLDSSLKSLYEIFEKLVHPILINNVFLLLSLIISVLITWNLFTKLIKNKKLISFVFSILFSFSIHFIFRAISITPAMYLTFFIPLVVFLLFRKTKPILMGISVFLILSFSNYYGYFSFVLVGLWYLSDLVLKKLKVSEFFKKIFLFSTPLIIGIVLFFFSLLKSNLPILSNYSKEQSQKPTARTTTVYRPIEDWYNLSFRPWYFFIPPKSSVFFGEFSKNIHERIKNTGYYLADDYMEEEMAGSYMGWHFLLGLGTVAVILLLKRYKNIEFKTFKTVYKNKEMIIRSFFIIFCILLISGPPSFTIGGVEIYTPTYLLYYIVPVFRTLVRWAVVIYLFVLIINSFLVQDLYNLMKNKFQKILFILSFLTLNFVIFAIKIPVININKPPQEIAFVKEKYPESVPYAVYPKGDYYSIFWIISHEDLLINPVNFVNYETGFDSNEFSKKLITEEGIREFLDKDPKYLIYYPENISNDDLEKIAEINPSLKSRENIYEFFRSNFGDGVVVGESVVFEINK